ncbi:MAG: anti-sigma factor [Chloroflexi bacterium]|nr:anti-sigma factor [Chloroflexota bacterium]
MQTNAPRSSLSCEAVEDLLPGEALHALVPEEQLAVQRHLAGCAACARTLHVYRDTVGALALGVPPARPPEALRHQVLAAALRERPARPYRPTPPVELAKHRRSPRITPIWGAVAAALIVSGGTGVWAASLQSQMEALQAKANRYDRIVGVLSSERLATRELQPVQAGVPTRATVYLDPTTGTGMAMVRDAPPIPRGRALQLWFVRGQERVSGGVLRLDSTGSGYTIITVPSDLTGFESIGITEEPATGSPWPTTPRLVGTAL